MEELTDQQIALKKRTDAALQSLGLTIGSVWKCKYNNKVMCIINANDFEGLIFLDIKEVIPEGVLELPESHHVDADNFLANYNNITPKIDLTI